MQADDKHGMESPANPEETFYLMGMFQFYFCCCAKKRLRGKRVYSPHNPGSRFTTVGESLWQDPSIQEQRGMDVSMPHIQLAPFILILRNLPILKAEAIML